APHLGRDDLCARLTWPDGTSQLMENGKWRMENGEFSIFHSPFPEEDVEVLVCLRDAQAESELSPALTALGLVQTPDVLDTWFSSGLWPMSTLGWPDPETAMVDSEQAPLGRQNGYADCLEYYYPGSCLVTARDIITLWVVRMVLMGL